MNEQRKRFMAMLQEAEAEGERNGFVRIDALAEELDAVIAETTRAAPL
ncbi:hypothetical protein [Azospirillum sp. sgz301742]